MYVGELHSITELLSSHESGMNSTTPTRGGLTAVYNSSRRSKRWTSAWKPLLNSSDKSKKAPAHEYRHLFKLLLLDELENSELTSSWLGNFSVVAVNLLSQHETRSGLSPLDRTLAQWSVYCDVNVDYHVSFGLFNDLLDNLVKSLQTEKFEDHEMFWDGAKKLLQSCYNLITKLKNNTTVDKPAKENIIEALKILQHFSRLDKTSIDLFPENQYEWLQRDRNLTIEEVLHKAVKQDALHRFQNIVESSKCEDSCEESRLQHLIILITLARSDLYKANEQYDEIFFEIMNFHYMKTLYGVYESKIASFVEPEVKEVCKYLKRVQNNECSTLKQGMADGLPNVDEHQLELGKTLIKLYLTVQKFLMFGQILNETDWSSYAIAKFHSWFFGGVAQWLDIAAYKALFLVEKAVNLDTLIPVDLNVNRSCSGTDTWDIFYPIKISWQQLAWPDVEDRYAFVAKIVNDICNCCEFYSDKMMSRVESVGTRDDKEVFEVTAEWCVAINNIDYLRQSLESFVQELGMDDIIKRLSETRTPKEAQRCKETMKNVIANAIDTIGFKLVNLLTIVVRKMMPSISRFLHEGTKLLHKDSSSMDRVMRYLETNLDKIHQNISNDNFFVILDIIWERLGDVLFELVQDNIKKRRPPSFFSNLNECFQTMTQSFRNEDAVFNSTTLLKEIEHLLTIHGKDTSKLIHHYHLDRWREQKTVQDFKDVKMGILTVRAQFLGSNLKVQVMNGRNLLPINSHETCDSCVKVKLLPIETFANVKTFITKAHKKNLFPLYDETFLIPLTESQCNTTDGLIHFIVKDQNLFGLTRTFMAEAYLNFSEISRTFDDINGLRQLMLPLTRTEGLDREVTKALEYRQGDQQARKFIKKQKRIVPFATSQFYAFENY